MVLHYGDSAELGHYDALVKDQETGDWFNISDSYVNPIGKED